LVLKQNNAKKIQNNASKIQSVHLLGIHDNISEHKRHLLLVTLVESSQK
jgi:hypothetical protein